MIKNIFLDFISLIILLIALTLFITTITDNPKESKESRNTRIGIMYNKILAQTGQSQNAIPLIIINKKIINAYTDGSVVVLYQGLIDLCTDDEIALVIGHELAHKMLGHTMVKHQFIEPNQAVNEANADKLGSIYMMKAGYDVCKGRNFFLKLKAAAGNSLGEDHPDYSYRWDELNINC